MVEVRDLGGEPQEVRPHFQSQVDRRARPPGRAAVILDTDTHGCCASLWPCRVDSIFAVLTSEERKPKQKLGVSDSGFYLKPWITISRQHLTWPCARLTCKGRSGAADLKFGNPHNSHGFFNTSAWQRLFPLLRSRIWDLLFSLLWPSFAGPTKLNSGGRLLP